MRRLKRTRLRLELTHDRALWLQAAHVVAAGAGVPLATIIQVQTRGRGRLRQVRLARILALYLANTALGLGVARLGRATGFGKRRVSALCHRGEDLRDDPVFDQLCERLTVQLRGTGD